MSGHNVAYPSPSSTGREADEQQNHGRPGTEQADILSYFKG